MPRRRLPRNFQGTSTSLDARRLGLDAASAPKFLAMAQSAYKKGDVESAYDAAYLAASCDRTLLDGWLMLGAVCAQFAQFKNARRCFNEVLKVQPEHVGALTASGEVAIAVKEFPVATQLLQKVVQLDATGATEASRRARMLLVSRHMWKLGLEAMAQPVASAAATKAAPAIAPAPLAKTSAPAPVAKAAPAKTSAPPAAKTPLAKAPAPIPKR